MNKIWTEYYEILSDIFFPLKWLKKTYQIFRGYIRELSKRKKKKK